MKNADPISLLILCAIIAASTFGTLSLRQSLLQDRQMQKGAFYTPPKEFSYASHAYPGAVTLPDLARDLCDPHTWATTLIPDTQTFLHVMQGGNPGDLGGFLNPPGMEYCRAFRTQVVDCDTLIQALPATTPKYSIHRQTILDAMQTLDVQTCGLVVATVIITTDEQHRTIHYLAAGKIQDRWRILLPLVL